MLELEDLLSTHLNTRSRSTSRTGEAAWSWEFATLEDLERIDRAMVGDGGVA